MRYDAQMRAADLLGGNIMCFCFYAAISLFILSVLVLIFSPHRKNLEHEVGKVAGYSTVLYFVCGACFIVHSLNGWQNIFGALVLGIVSWVFLVFTSQLPVLALAQDIENRVRAQEEAVQEKQWR